MWNDPGHIIAFSENMHLPFLIFYIHSGNLAACWDLIKIFGQKTLIHWPLFCEPLESYGLREMWYHLILKSGYTIRLEKFGSRRLDVKAKKNILNPPLIFFLCVCSFLVQGYLPASFSSFSGFITFPLKSNLRDTMAREFYLYLSGSTLSFCLTVIWVHTRV